MATTAHHNVELEFEKTNQGGAHRGLGSGYTRGGRPGASCCRPPGGQPWMAQVAVSEPASYVPCRIAHGSGLMGLEDVTLIVG